MDWEDEVAIRNLISRVAWMTDHWEKHSEYIDCWTEDGTWQIEGTTEVYEGHDGLSRRIQEMLDQKICGPGLSTRHCVTSLEVIRDESDPDKGKAKSFIIMVHGDADPSIAGYGEYHDEVRRVDGRWLLADRLIKSAWS